MNFTESIDLDLLKKLTKCNLLKRSERRMLTKYKALMNEMEKIEVSYEQKIENVGRFFALHGLSLQSFSKKIRHTLVHTSHLDIDIINCHPILLLQYCKKQNIKCRYLTEYVKNREGCITNLMDAYHTERKIVKELFISVMYLGKVDTYLRRHNLNSVPDSDVSFIHLFAKEMDDISKVVVERNPELYKHMIDNPKPKKNPASRTMSYVLGQLENEIIQHALVFLTKKGFTVETLCFDGLLVLKKNIEKNLLESMTTYCKKQSKYEVHFDFKEMNEVIDIDKENEKHAYTMKEDYMDIPYLSEIKADADLKYMKVPKTGQEEIKKITKYNAELKAYNEFDNKMDYFEQYHAKVLNPSSILTLGGSNFRMSNYRDFENNYKNVKVNFAGSTLPFTRMWCESPDIRTYENIDFVPYPLVCPEHTFNTFTGLEAIKTESKGANVDWFREHLFLLCGKDEAGTDYMMNYLAHMVQKAGELPRVACVFRSVEGVGKNTFFESFGKHVLGQQYILQTAEPDDVIGRFNLNQNKLMVIMDEAQGKDMFASSEKIKNLITAVNLKWESKGVNCITLKNLGRYIFFSNNETPVKIGNTDRRFIMFECSADVANNQDYFATLINNFKTQGREIYDMLMERDISNWNSVSDRVKTSVYEEVQSATIPVMARFLEDMYFKHNESLEYNGDDMTEFMGEPLFKLYSAFLRDNGYKFEVTNTKFGREIKKYEGIEKKRSKFGTNYTINYDILMKYLIKMSYVEDDFDDFEVI